MISCQRSVSYFLSVLWNSRCCSATALKAFISFEACLVSFHSHFVQTEPLVGWLNEICHVHRVIIPVLYAIQELWQHLQSRPPCTCMFLSMLTSFTHWIRHVFWLFLAVTWRLALGNDGHIVIMHRIEPSRESKTPPYRLIFFISSLCWSSRID